METYAALAEALAAHGLMVRGGFAPEESDGVPPLAEGSRAAVLVLVGNVGAAMWPHFAPHSSNGADPLDRWTEAVIGPVADRFGGCAVYPFDRPALPFQRWAMRAEPVHSSPLGILIHPDHGLWHAYRAALLFATPIELPPRVNRPIPCETCAARPCLSACPVGAFTGASYAVAECAAHLAGAAGTGCLDQGCRARASCPVGTPYPGEQIRFHMAAFRRAVAPG